jgi:hypothetical protein
MYIGRYVDMKPRISSFYAAPDFMPKDVAAGP